MKSIAYVLHNNHDLHLLIRKMQAKGVNPDRPVLVEVSWYKPKRSLAQNRLNWKWCTDIRNWLWESGIGYQGVTGESVRPYTAEEIHEFNKHLFLEPRVIQIKGKTLTTYDSHNLTVPQFTEFLQCIDFHWGQQGCQLEHPDYYVEAMGQ